MENEKGKIAETVEHLEQIFQFVNQASGLNLTQRTEDVAKIVQSTDGKAIDLHLVEVQEVIPRSDSEGQGFLQVNFLSGKKILLTERLVGFKPANGFGLDMDKLPKVVTTPDLISVVEAIEESMSANDCHPVEVDILKRVFDAVLAGGEAVGFDLEQERVWLQRLTPSTMKSSS